MYLICFIQGEREKSEKSKKEGKEEDSDNMDLSDDDEFGVPSKKFKTDSTSSKSAIVKFRGIRLTICLKI